MQVFWLGNKVLKLLQKWKVRMDIWRQLMNLPKKSAYILQFIHNIIKFSSKSKIIETDRPNFISQVGYITPLDSSDYG